MKVQPSSRTPSTGRRARARAQVEADVLRLGREQLATLGAPALSLRQIARDLGMVSSAVYRYVASRDELLTLLLVDAYDELADHVESSLRDASDPDPDVPPPERGNDGVVLIAHAVREWALAEPARYALLYGSPVPGYRAPAEQTSGPGTRVVAMILNELRRHGSRASRGIDVGGLVDGFDAIRSEFGADLDDQTLLMATCLWSAIIGAVSVEVFGQYGPDTFSQPRTLFDLQMRTILTALLPTT